MLKLKLKLKEPEKLSEKERNLIESAYIDIAHAMTWAEFLPLRKYVFQDLRNADKKIKELIDYEESISK